MTETLASAPAAAAAWHEPRILWTRRWTDRLFSFAVERPEGFRFRSGEFIMLGLAAPGGAGKPIFRAYSIASPNWADELEFFSIQVPDGPLTSRLGQLVAGDRILLGRKPTGTLVLDALTGGRRLFLIASGTGLAPWLSVLRDPDTWERFDQVVVTHTVRKVQELAYRTFLKRDLFDDPLVGDLAQGRLFYYPTVTREPFERPGRITSRIASGILFSDLGLSSGFDPATDRAMLCGSTAMIREVAALLEQAGLAEGSNAAPGDYVLERAFVG
ncbi:ferredoxin--NADP reductase [Brevundimonas sp.]|uniref:ferredoxin--NADP reductase n=1 Tax=Brevundimonas sp. TaxID=1871086 RepID=UPI003F710CF5